MAIPTGLMSCAGRWSGTNHLQDPMNNVRESSPATAVIASAIGGRFLRMEYTWSYQGKPQEGTMLIGTESNGPVTAYWADTWHMSDKVMVCIGTENSDGGISVRGSYSAPPGPDWGWRIDLAASGANGLRLIMFNITPEGKEDLAVEATFTRD